jgi:capsular polysaccharide biosynthesis protein
MVYHRHNHVFATGGVRYRVGDSFRLIVAQKVGRFSNLNPFLTKELMRSFHQHLRNPNPTRHIYITRRHDRRGFESDLEFVALEKIIPRLEAVYPGNMTVKEQFELVSSASVIIAAHGNALTNLLYCHPNVTVVELESVDGQSFAFHVTGNGLNKSNYLSIGHNDHAIPGDLQLILILMLHEICYEQFTPV